MAFLGASTVRLPIEADAYSVSTYELVPRSELVETSLAQRFAPHGTATDDSVQTPRQSGCEVLHKFRRVPNRYTPESGELMSVLSPYTNSKRSDSGARSRAGAVLRGMSTKGTQTDSVCINLTRLAERWVPVGFHGVTIRCQNREYVEDCAFEKRGWRW